MSNNHTPVDHSAADSAWETRFADCVLWERLPLRYLYRTKVSSMDAFAITINWRCRSLMATRSDIEQSLDATRADRSFFGHPRGLATLFFTEMWERFSYYGMRALLILFMTASVERGGLGLPVTKAGAVYGLYTAMVYLLSLPGGWVADRLLGLRRSVFWGGCIIAAGH